MRTAPSTTDWALPAEYIWHFLLGEAAVNKSLEWMVPLLRGDHNHVFTNIRSPCVRHFSGDATPPWPPTREEAIRRSRPAAQEAIA